ncbi:hypothetical protein D1AOALGA4SA_12037 [Olavius algarvensis Delta 1 endosymbiont]|nr:hypothetical protein D1AOALGA4SA_12037 [Olavius algarvensis Delta 1 endosymbiont]
MRQSPISLVIVFGAGFPAGSPGLQAAKKLSAIFRQRMDNFCYAPLLANLLGGLQKFKRKI